MGKRRRLKTTVRAKSRATDRKRNRLWEEEDQTTQDKWNALKNKIHTGLKTSYPIDMQSVKKKRQHQTNREKLGRGEKRNMPRNMNN